ncbi:PREDICTED: GTPase-activating protein-like [Acropora digitifera]|uniref:GTPase-activating protein-like n=1 Tax=Acropora digitifera TaxID=70779 RepID=UPI00077AC7C1|nr:PREDICTED: GTPase-activating protein-like [Acropora digitifera]
MAGLEDLTVLLEEEKPEESSFHKQIKVLKDQISELSKTNYDLEKEVRLLDQHIGFLVTYKKAIEESSENFLELERKYDVAHSDDKQQEKYGNLFFLLQTEASYLAQLTRIVSLGEIDDLLQPVLFSLYGNQYEAREEHLLLTMFQLALKYEVSESETFNSLLRANTAITRMMTTYTRRAPGQEYLKATLGELVKEVVEQKDLVLEINPQKVYPEIYGTFADSAEKAMDDHAVQLKIRERITKIINMTSKFVKAITESLLKVPYGIRWLCSAIVTLVKVLFSFICAVL